MITRPWTGTWVTDRLGIALHTVACPGGLEVPELVGLAVRRNARRAHLLVSTVLGKHIPTDPHVVYASGRRLGGLVADALGGGPVDALVFGYAETATGLGHCVADELGAADYLHSTRRAVPGVEPSGAFEEEHSHATSHLVLPRDPALIARDRPMVLVDDELSTGRTVLNTIRALHRRAPRDHYVVAALVDMRSAADRELLDGVVAELGARIDVVSLAAGSIDLPPDLLDRGAALVEEVLNLPPLLSQPRETAMRASSGRASWPAGLPVGGRHGFTPADRVALAAALPGIVEALPPVGPAARVLVLGSEELMYLPLRLAGTLADARPDLTVASHATTRSPVLAVPDAGYPIRHALTFPAHDGQNGDRFVYNVGDRHWDLIVAVVDELGDTPALRAGLVAQLRHHADHVHVLTVPA